MKSKLPNIIPSGIEPVDKLLGGLESNQLYLVHGDAVGKSLFGIKYLIEGLKRGENGALVIRYSPEDAVRRFARLGYDCLEDVYSGRLVILEYSNDIIQQIARLRELTPVLRELEWLLGETRAERLVFDPVTNLVLGEEGNLESRVREFALWATSFGATVVMVAGAENEEVIEEFRPLVQESFRFEVNEDGERATRFLAFEKSSAIPDQTIEVDPSRGVFLLGRSPAENIFSKFQVMQPVSAEPETVNIEAQEIEILQEGEILHEGETAAEEPPATADTGFAPVTVEMKVLTEEPLAEVLMDEEPPAPLPELEPIEAEPEPVAAIEAQNLFEAEIIDSDETAITEASQPAAPEGYYSASQLDTQPLSADKMNGILAAYDQERQSATSDPVPAQNHPTESPQNIFSDLLDELSSDPSPLELDAFDDQPAPALEATEQPADVLSGIATAVAETSPDQEAVLQDESQAEAAVINEGAFIDEVGAMSERDIDALVTSRAVEILLRPPEWRTETPSPFNLTEPPASAKAAAQAGPEAPQNVQPKDFNVLVIDDDTSSCEAVVQTLSDYTVEVVHDGVSGLAKLISFKPDLIILDVDLPIIDGFKVLAHIRTSLNMPVIIVSGSHMRASDRVLAAELGADYYLTKPFSVKELRQKARQLIARYRGIASWIITAPTASETRAQIEQKNESQIEPAFASHYYTEPVGEFLRYDDFVAQVEKSVKAGIDNGTSFSIVGCRLPDMTANGGMVALRLYELVRSLVRDTDLVSTNPRNDLVILLADADTTGARAFIARMREQILKEMNQEPTVWVRSFPDLEETTDSTPSSNNDINGSTPSRRASDRSDQQGSDAQSRSSDSPLNARSASVL